MSVSTVRKNILLLTAASLALSACGFGGISTSTGPSARAINKAPAAAIPGGVAVVDVDQAVVGKLAANAVPDSFEASFGNAMPVGTVAQNGDTIEVSIWEAPPSTLFGSPSGDSRFSTSPQTIRSTTLPEQMVGLNGRIVVPFAGPIAVVGRTPTQIEAAIVDRLKGKAHLPQVIVRITRNASANVTIVGEVANSTRMPLTPKGERLLDALAQAGGTREAIGKMTIQITRGDSVKSMPLEDVVRNPRQNIVLATGDIVTAFYRPYNFTVLGAANRNEEIPFEATGISLAQALGRIGGLQAQRANPKGVFIFRWEDPDSVSGDGIRSAANAEGRVPVIYRVNLRDPATYFAAQKFMMQNRDIVYISNAPLADFERFVTIISSTVLPIVAVENSLTN